MSAVVHSFLEGAVWDRHDHPRPVRQPVHFRVFSIGKLWGERIDSPLFADFGIFYDPEDQYLLEVLSRQVGMVPWSRLVFWRLHHRGEIEVIDPSSEETVARIVVQRRMGGDPSGEIDWTNVVQPIGWRR